MAQYEILYIVPGSHTEEELQPVREKVNALIAKAAGSISLDASLGKRKLAYPVDGVHHGYYLLSEFDADASKLKQLDHELTLSTEVLRHVIIKRESNAPSFPELQRQLEDREQRRQAARRQAEVKAQQEEREEAKPAQPTSEEPKTVKPKVKIEDLDEKLEEILEGDIL